MEKRLRSSLKSSADEFLSSATKLGSRSVKPSLKTLIHSLKPSSDVVSSLPLSLHNSISQSITRFKDLCGSTTAAGASSYGANSPLTPPTKRVRRSSRLPANIKKDENDSVPGLGRLQKENQERRLILSFYFNLLHTKIWKGAADSCIRKYGKVQDNQGSW